MFFHIKVRDLMMNLVLPPNFFTSAIVNIKKKDVILH